MAKQQCLKFTTKIHCLEDFALTKAVDGSRSQGQQQSHFPSHSSHSWPEKCCESSEVEKNNFFFRKCIPLLGGQWLLQRIWLFCSESQELFGHFWNRPQKTRFYGQYFAHHHHTSTEKHLFTTKTKTPRTMSDHNASCDLLMWNTIDFQLGCV